MKNIFLLFLTFSLSLNAQEISNESLGEHDVIVVRILHDKAIFIGTIVF